MDGKEIHYASSRTSVMDHSWSTKGNHVMKVVCHAAAPMSATPGFRQYDMFIDGQSFFTMPKVYELGVRGVTDRAPVRPYGQIDHSYGGGDAAYYGSTPPGPPLHIPSSREEEEEELQRAIKASLQESRAHLSERSTDVRTIEAPTSDLLDFGVAGSDAPTPPISAPHGLYSSALTLPSDLSIPTQAYPALSDSFGGAPALPTEHSHGPHAGTSGYFSSPPNGTVSSSFAPPPAALGVSAYANPAGSDSVGYTSGPSYFTAQDDPFAPKQQEPPSHRDISSEILAAYGPSSSTYMSSAYPTGMVPGPAYGSAPSVSGNETFVMPLPLENGGVEAEPATIFTMNGLVETEEKPSDPFEAALKKLVNVDHIDEPAQEKLKLARKKEEEENKKKRMGKSQPKPPAAQQIVGSQATLSQIQSVKPSSATAREGVMNAAPQLWHPNASMAGALVVHGTHPPPLQQPGFVGQGFGAGYNPYAYQQQYQQQQQQQQQQHQQQYSYH